MNDMRFLMIPLFFLCLWGRTKNSKNNHLRWINQRRMSQQKLYVNETDALISLKGKYIRYIYVLSRNGSMVWLDSLVIFYSTPLLEYSSIHYPVYYQKFSLLWNFRGNWSSLGFSFDIFFVKPFIKFFICNYNYLQDKIL